MFHKQVFAMFPGGGITRAVISNLAQILFLFFLIPVCLIIIELIVPNAAAQLAAELAGEVPFLGMWLSVIGSLLQTTVQSTYPVYDVLSDVFKTIIVAVCVKLAGAVHYKCGLYGLPILAATVGIVVAMILSSIISALFGGIVALLVYGGVVIIMLIGIWLLLSSVFSSLQFSFSLFTYHTALAAISAIAASGYVAMMALILGGYMPNFWASVVCALAGTVLMVVSSILLYIDSKMADQEEKERKRRIGRFP